MQNLAVSSQLATHGAKAQKVDATSSGAASDIPVEELPATGKFGALLAMQIALAAPQDAAAVEAVLKGTAKETAKTEKNEGQDAAALLGMLPQALADSTLIPVQKILAAAAHAPAAAAPGLSMALAKAGAADGKELPVNAAPIDGASAAQALPKTADMPNMPDMAEPEQLQFSTMLAEKKAEPALPDTAPALNNSASAQQMQSANLLPSDKVPATNQPLSVPQRVGAENWGTGLGDKVVWVVGNQMRGAEIHLNPPALGPLEVRVNITDGQANVSFMTQHASVREAIEAATPRLREMLGDSGIGMGSVSVNVGSFAQQQQTSSQEQDRSSWHSTLADAAFPGEAVTTFVQPLLARGMVDFFA